MQQPRRSETLIPLRPHLHKLLLGDEIPQMLILLFLLTHAHPWHRLSTLGRVVMTRPDFHMIC